MNISLAVALYTKYSENCKKVSIKVPWLRRDKQITGHKIVGWKKDDFSKCQSTIFSECDELSILLQRDWLYTYHIFP